MNTSISVACLLTLSLGGCGGSSTPDAGPLAIDAAPGSADASAAVTINGCTVATATVMTTSSNVTINFGVDGDTYSPPCVIVASGATVTFAGSFATHPLEGGTVVNGVPTPATTGPFTAVTSSGTSKTFTMSSSGTFPYFCENHASLGMYGVVYVD